MTRTRGVFRIIIPTPRMTISTRVPPKNDTVPVAIDAVYKQVVTIRREQEENRDVTGGKETRAQSTDEREETSGPGEVRTGRGSAGLVQGG